jgi:transcriptional regulator with XRE-family HTH domain
MDERQAREEGLIARRLNALWPTRQKDGKPYSLREAASAINEQEGRDLVSASYLSALRIGERAEPSYAILTALARFFGVSLDSFSGDEATARHSEAELRLLRALQDSGVRNLALCAADLSPDSLATITEIVQKFRASEGLPEAPQAND